MTVSRKGGVPLYQQIAKDMATQIAEGAIDHGQQLPTELQLITQYQVSRLTVRKALEVLESQGLIARYRGKGTFVTSAKVTMELSPQEGFYASLMKTGLNPATKLLDLTMVKCSPEILADLGNLSPQRAQRLQRLYLIDRGTTPIALAESYFRPPLHYSHAQAQRMVVYELLENVSGFKMVTSHYTISASPASPYAAHALNVVIGYPVLLLKRQSVDASGSPLVVTIITMVSDFYKLHVTLQSSSGVEDPFLAGSRLVVTV